MPRQCGSTALHGIQQNSTGEQNGSGVLHRTMPMTLPFIRTTYARQFGSHVSRIMSSASLSTAEKQEACQRHRQLCFDKRGQSFPRLLVPYAIVLKKTAAPDCRNKGRAPDC
jgi:hypothetical protein